MARTYHESQDKPTYVIREIRESVAPERVRARSGGGLSACDESMGVRLRRGCVAALRSPRCSGPGTQPTPAGTATPPPPAVNTPPQIKSITLSETRVEVGMPVTLTAIVEDAETPVANLTYGWTAPNGDVLGRPARSSPGPPGRTRRRPPTSCSR